MFGRNYRQDRQNQITYNLKTESDDSTTLFISKDNDTLKIGQWTPGALGITLGEGEPPVKPGNIYNGDQHAPLDTNNANSYNWSVTSWAANGTLIGGIVEANFNDVITGSSEADQINGLGGNDALDGGAGDDEINGGESGSDTIYGGTGNDEILSATGLYTPQRSKTDDDWQPPAGKTARIKGSTWGVSVGKVYTVYGGGSLAQDDSPDVIFAGDGNDSVTAGRGRDFIDGGLDNDTLRPASAISSASAPA